MTTEDRLNLVIGFVVTAYGDEYNEGNTVLYGCHFDGDTALYDLCRAYHNAIKNGYTNVSVERDDDNGSYHLDIRV